MRILLNFRASDVYGVSDADAFDDFRASFFMARAYQNESICWKESLQLLSRCGKECEEGSITVPRLGGYRYRGESGISFWKNSR
jgi:hypothetical protein